ncbi:LytTR family DNA-binding domain-containing protein [Phenylobacterium immobile]|uniref:LytTR family DNA-binding domain-containing protein n=1 Tax=Phenylobacterium immobile TaxID=21 RepID=UPI000A545234|nr:LytTR family DNA-binding domain-containing protein [Phenylobacterium immobile]
MTDRVRQSPGQAARASRSAGWFARYVATPGVVVGLFLSIIGAYGSDRMAFGVRSAYFIAIAMIASAMGAGIFKFLQRQAWIGGRWLRGLVAALVMTAPMGIVVWLAQRLVDPPGPPVSALPAFMAFSLATSLFFCLVVAALRAIPKATTLPETTSTLTRFLDRLPPRLRGGDIWAVEAEDHYLRLHTSRGQDLILMRLVDAVAELAEIEGARVHRSWWVARDAVAEIRRRDGGATLVLKDGCEVPVSRPNARTLKGMGWY